MSLLAALILAAAGTLEVSERTELRIRDGSDRETAGVELEAAPTAVFGLRTRTDELSLTYAPRFVVRDVDLRPVFEALHGLSLAASTRDRRTVLSAFADASYGTTTTTALALATPTDTEAAAAQSIPDGGTIAYAASRVGLGVTHAASRRLALRGSVEEQVSGGANDVGRALIPQQTGPRLTLGADLALTRSDRASTAFEGSYAAFSTEAEAAVAQLEETYRRTWSRRTATSLGVGLAGSWSRPSEGGPEARGLYPTARAALTWRAPSELLEANLSLAVSPVIDRLEGSVDERLYGTLAAAWRLTSSAGVRAQVAAAQSLPWTDPESVSLGAGEAAFWLRWSPRARTELGTQGALQSGQDRLSWVLFVATTFTMQPAHF